MNNDTNGGGMNDKAIEPTPLLAEALDILRLMTDPDPCDYDHHDLCQAHSLHDRPCPHERAKELFKRIEANDKDNLTQDTP